MTYLQRDNEKTLGELQRDLEALRSATRDEKKCQMVLELVAQKRKLAIDRMMKLFAHEVSDDEQKQELIGMFSAEPPAILLEPQVPVRPVILAFATGRLSNARELNASNNTFFDDDSAVALGHLIGSSPHTQNLECVVLGGTSVRCRGLEAIILGAIRRYERLRTVCAPFSLHAFNTSMYDDPAEKQEVLKRLVSTVTSNHPNISIEL